MNAFGLPTSSGGGSSKPYVKYDSRAGRMLKVDRRQNGAGEWEAAQVDITADAVFVADFANTRTGWMSFPAGAAPQKHLVKIGDPLPQRPADIDDKGKPLFKAGFEFDLVLNGEQTVRELGSVAQVAIDGFGAAYGAYLNAAESKAGKLPVLKLAGAKPVKSGQSTNYEPILQIVSWIDRPAVFDASPAPAAPAPAPVSSGFASPPPAPAAASGGASGFAFG